MPSDVILVALIGGPLVAILSPLATKLINQESNRFTRTKNELDIYTQIIDELKERVAELREEVGEVRGKYEDCEQRLRVMERQHHVVATVAYDAFVWGNGLRETLAEHSLPARPIPETVDRYTQEMWRVGDEL